MKKVCLLLLLLGGLYSILKMYITPIPTEGDLLLTYPRSGTNWTIGVVQALLKRPVRFIDQPYLKEHPGVNRLKIELDETLPTLYRSHYVDKIVKQIDQSHFRLLFTLRNYKECIVKELQLSADQLLEGFRKRDRKVEMYFDNLRFFESQWHNPKTRHLIVYEEMIKDPKTAVTNLLAFLGENSAGVPAFFEGYEEWNKKMLTSYHEQHADRGPPSNNDPRFHSKNFPKEVLREIDALVEARWPDLWETYLKRYKESD